MRLISVEYLNWCQHHHKQEEFHPGLTAIIGPNGSGKSNFLGGVRWLLTGVNPNPGVKEDNISQFSGAGETAYGVLLVEHGNVRMQITRTLVPESRKSKLEIMTPGDARAIETLYGDNKVNPRVEAILGVDFDTFNEIGLVAQEDIFGFLAQKPAKRAAAFQKLFRVEEASRLCDVLGKRINATAVPQVAANLDAMLQEVAELESQLATLEIEDAQLPPMPQLAEGQAVDQRVLTDWATRQHQQSMLARQVETIVRYQTQERLADVQVEAASLDVATLTDAANGARPQAQEAALLLRQAEQAKTLAAARVQQETMISKQIQYIAERHAPVQPDNYVADVQPLQAELLTLQQKIGRDEQMLRDLALHQRTECPTCHTRIEGGLADELARAVRELPGDKARRQQLADAEHWSKQYDQALAVYQTQHESRVRDLQHMQEQAALMEQMAPPEIDQAVLATQVATLAQYELGLKEYRKILHDRQTALAGIRGVITEACRQSRMTEEALASLNTEEQHYTAARARVDLRAQQIARRATLDPALVGLRTQRSILVGNIAAARIAQAQANVQCGWLAHIGAMRDVLHWENLPTWVIRRNLQRLSVTTNETLELFQTDFRVEADNELTFRAHFVDGRTQLAERLSWGQKVVLALAVRLGLNLRVAPQLGFLGLDEPTAYLDQHHIRGFTPVLQRLHALTASRHLQCVMVTHEQTLGPLFDKVIQL